MKNNHTSQYQQELEEFRKRRCLTCNGLGFTSNSPNPIFFNQTHFKEVRCTACKGTGLKPVKSRGKKRP
jgi:DnaJ-class molecular chaperone